MVDQHHNPRTNQRSNTVLTTNRPFARLWLCYQQSDHQHTLDSQTHTHRKKARRNKMKVQEEIGKLKKHCIFLWFFIFILLIGVTLVIDEVNNLLGGEWECAQQTQDHYTYRTQITDTNEALIQHIQTHHENSTLSNGYIYYGRKKESCDKWILTKNI